MVDKRAMRELLKEMERAVEEILQHDSAFFEALQALKWEIDSDSRVQSAVRSLQAGGQKVFSSFVPRIKVRIRTEECIFALPRRLEIPNVPAAEPIATLTRELKDAVSAVIMRSGHCQELGRIVNEAVAANGNFEKLASQIETAGHEVLISLDLSAYDQVRQSSAPVRRFERAPRQESSQEPANAGLSVSDLDFLKALGIKADQDLSATL